MNILDTEAIIAEHDIRQLTIDIEKSRANFDAMGMRAPLPLGTQVEDVNVDGIPTELLTVSRHPSCAILFLHGGGYVFGSPRSHRPLTSRLAHACNAKVIAIDYRLAPQHRYPAALDDACRAYRWVRSNLTEAKRCFIVGDSSGGGMTLSTMVALRDAGEELPTAGVCISPWSDMTSHVKSMLANARVDPILSARLMWLLGGMALDGQGRARPDASPLYADLQGLPPLLIQAGTREVLLDDAKLLVEKLKASGVSTEFRIWRNMIHVWHLYASVLNEGQLAIEEIGSFLKNQIRLAAENEAIS